jgi:hypothetical protein
MLVANTLRASLRWIALALGVAAALYFLNSALFSAWMSSGPPNPYPAGWALRSKSQLLYCVATLVAGIAVFRAAGQYPRVDRVTWSLALASLLFSVAPTFLHAWYVDVCLDQSGRWSHIGNQCEH